MGIAVSSLDFFPPVRVREGSVKESSSIPSPREAQVPMWVTEYKNAITENTQNTLTRNKTKRELQESRV